jgi:hypothetical protein
MKEPKVTYLIPFSKRLKNPESLDEIYSLLKVLALSKQGIYMRSGGSSWRHTNSAWAQSTPLCMVIYHAKHTWYLKVQEGYTVATNRAELNRLDEQLIPRTVKYLVVTEEIKKYV